LSIVATVNGDRSVDMRRDVTLGQLITAAGGDLRGSGTAVSQREVAGLPAWQQAIRIAAWSIAKHELAVWRGQDINRRRVTATWQSRLFGGSPDYLDPSLTWFYVWECVEASLTARNNAVLRLHGDLTVDRVEVVHPDNVTVKWDASAGEPVYRVRQADGRWSDPLGPLDVVHFRVGSVEPGAIWAPSPVEMHRRALGAALARSGAEENLYRGGAMKSVAVVFPDDVSPEQAQAFKDVYLGPGGVTGDGQVKVFGGNPRIETIGLSLADSQYVEAQGFSIYDVGRILGVPPSLLWASTADGDKPITPEHEEDRWWRYGLHPRRIRIESTLKAHPKLFGSSARDYPGFVVDSVSSDARTESENLTREVQAGILLADEARAKRGLGPLPDGAGQIPQIVPVGGMANPVTVAP
jgi:HK97 family phage portal protein